MSAAADVPLSLEHDLIERGIRVARHRAGRPRGVVGVLLGGLQHVVQAVYVGAARRRELAVSVGGCTYAISAFHSAARALRSDSSVTRLLDAVPPARSLPIAPWSVRGRKNGIGAC